MLAIIVCLGTPTKIVDMSKQILCNSNNKTDGLGRAVIYNARCSHFIPFTNKCLATSNFLKAEQNYILLDLLPTEVPCRNRSYITISPSNNYILGGGSGRRFYMYSQEEFNTSW